MISKSTSQQCPQMGFVFLLFMIVFVGCEMTLYQDTSPDKVKDLQIFAGDSQLVMYWRKPNENDIDKLKIIRNTGWVPANPKDGVCVYNGGGETYLDTGLTNGVLYHYAFFCFNDRGDYSNSGSLSCTPVAGINSSPTITALEPYFNAQAPGGTVLLQAQASDPEALYMVTADLQQIGGKPALRMYDNGTRGDKTAGDGIFSRLAVLGTDISKGSKDISFTATDPFLLTASDSTQLYVGDIYMDYPVDYFDIVPRPSGGVLIDAASSGDSVYVVHEDFGSGDGGPDIIFRYSYNKGVTWSAPARLDLPGNPNMIASHPRVVCSGSHVYVIWCENGPSEFLAYAVSSNRGVTWDIKGSGLNGGDDFEVACSGQNVYICWVGYPDIYTLASTNGGKSWQTSPLKVNGTDGSYNILVPKIAAEGNNVYVTWADHDATNKCVYFNSSLNKGVSWGIPQKVNANPMGMGAGRNPVVKSSGNKVYVSWGDSRDNDYDIYINMSSDEGATWPPTDLRIDDADTGDSFFSQHNMVVSDNLVILTWDDSRDIQLHHYGRFSRDGGFSWGIEDKKLTIGHSGSTLRSSISAEGDLICFAYYNHPDIFVQYSTDQGQSWLAKGIHFHTPEFFNSNSWDPVSTTSVDTFNVFWTWQKENEYPTRLYYMRGSIPDPIFPIELR